MSCDPIEPRDKASTEPPPTRRRGGGLGRGPGRKSGRGEERTAHLEHGLHGVGDAGEPVPGGGGGLLGFGRRLRGRGDGGVGDGVEERLDAAEQVAGVGGAERGDGAEAAGAEAEAEAGSGGGGGGGGGGPRRGRGEG